MSRTALWFVIVTFNSEKTVENALNSIIDCIQHPNRIIYGFDDIGVCISDDGSTDKTKILIDSFNEYIKSNRELSFVKVIININKKNLGTVRNTLVAFEIIKKNMPTDIDIYIKGLAGDDRLVPGIVWEAYNNCLVHDLDIQFNSVLVYRDNKFLSFKVSMLDILSRNTMGKILLTKYHYVMTIGNLVKLDHGIELKKQAINYGLVLLDDWIDTVLSVSSGKCKYLFSNLPTVKYSIFDTSVMRSKSLNIRATYKSDIILQNRINSECELIILQQNDYLFYTYKHAKSIYKSIILIYRFFVVTILFISNLIFSFRYKNER